MTLQSPGGELRQSSMHAESWRRSLPVLTNGAVTLREARPADAVSLLTHLTGTNVCRYIAPPPTTVHGFLQFIRCARRQRRGGVRMTFGVVPPGESDAVGVFQLWRMDHDFSTGEFGFVLGEAYWGAGIAVAAGQLLLDFAFSHVGVHRLEARTVEANTRANRVLTRLGATRERVLRRAFRDSTKVHDHTLWSLLAEDWIPAR